MCQVSMPTSRAASRPCPDIQLATAAVEADTNTLKAFLDGGVQTMLGGFGSSDRSREHILSASTQGLAEKTQTLGRLIH